MGYRVAAQNGDMVAVPQVVFAHLPRAEGDAVRVALYLLGGGAAEPRTIAHDLGLKSIEAAKRALQYWAGAGLLEKDSAAPAAPEPAPVKIDLAALNDPYVAVLCQEAQAALGRALGRSEMLRLVGLYLNDGWQPDVILTCCAEAARQNRPTAAAVCRELQRWREAGVETGEDAERYLKQEALRAQRWAQTAALFGAGADKLTRWERTAITRWYEEWGFDDAMIEEALLRAEAHRTVRYVDGILRAWRAQGLLTVDAVRGKGQLAGSNILSTGARPAAATAKKDLFHADWNAVFDDEPEE